MLSALMKFATEQMELATAEWKSLPERFFRLLFVLPFTSVVMLIVFLLFLVVAPFKFLFGEQAFDFFDDL